MNWFFTSPRQAALERRRGGTAPGAQQERAEAIRCAMLDTLDGVATPAARALTLRIFHAGDVERLWDLRPEAMSVLASWRGEAFARQALARISVHFKDVLPEGLDSKLRAVDPAPSPAANRRLLAQEETS